MIHSDTITCPGLFYPTKALDGIICRIRTPAGVISSQQCRAIASLAQTYGDGFAQITNRANWQLRGFQSAITNPIVISELQKLNLAGVIPETDHLRNLMASPTAGIDENQLIDTRIFVNELDKYISTHRHLAKLPPKFSIGVDGGEKQSIAEFHNEIVFSAIEIEGKIFWRLGFSVGKNQPLEESDVVVEEEKGTEMAIALISAYLEYIPKETNKKPRLRDILQQWGIEEYLSSSAKFLSFSPFHYPPQAKSLTTTAKPVGIYRQKQQGYSYVGVAISLGKLSSIQMLVLAELAEIYGSGTLRITPWQNLIISDVKQEKMGLLLKEMEVMGFVYRPEHISSNLVACAGNSGCASSACDTQTHAHELIEALGEMNKPLSIHISGCSKSCARQTMADISLVGSFENNQDAYDVYVADTDKDSDKFGKLVYSNIPFEKIPELIKAYDS